MYESPAYWELKKTITHWETIRKYIDLARTFRSMTYGEHLTLSSTKDRFGHDHDHEITLSDSLRTDTLEFIAQRCEDIAFKFSESAPKPFDVREATKV